MTGRKIPHYFQGAAIPPRRAQGVFNDLLQAVEYTYMAGRARVMHLHGREGGKQDYQTKLADFQLSVTSRLFVTGRR